MSKTKPTIIRQIRSYVKREGRLTKGQTRALDDLWPQFGRNLSQGKCESQNAIFEIGFGNGESLAAMAKAAPEQHFIGVEVHRPGVGALLLQIEALELNNITIFQEDAIAVLKSCIADQSLQRLQLYFPDPWPKKKHHKRRIVQPEFVELVHQKLQSGGQLHMATDWQPYAEHMLELLSATPGFVNVAGEGCYSPKPQYRPETKFERRGQRLGHGVWDLLFQKT